MSLTDRTTMRAFIYCVLFLLTFSFALSVTHAQDDASTVRPREISESLRLPPRAHGRESNPSSTSKPSASGGGLWTTVISLAAIVGCLVIVGHWIKPFLGAPRGLPVEAFELLGRRLIEQKIAVHLIRCGNRVLVVSVSPEGARTLSEITDPEEVLRLTDACHNQAAAPRFSVPSFKGTSDTSAGINSSRRAGKSHSSTTHPAGESSHV
jgi:flagellar biogenesis protein FliO